jgi:hypothetical protein
MTSLYVRCDGIFEYFLHISCEECKTINETISRVENRSTKTVVFNYIVSEIIYRQQNIPLGENVLVGFEKYGVRETILFYPYELETTPGHWSWGWHCSNDYEYEPDVLFDENETNLSVEDENSDAETVVIPDDNILNNNHEEIVPLGEIWTTCYPSEIQSPNYD